jgi:hypothetical protein
VLRLGSRFANAGFAAFGFGVPGSGSISTLGAVPPGTASVRHYQVWYRNVADFCTPAGFNLTNGVRVTWIS